MTEPLSPAEARVIAALVEKSIATPQYYPMTVNAILAAANQKSARDPVMNLSEGEVGAALNALETRKLVRRDDLAGRVPKWRHQFQHQMLLKPPALALLVTLMLRGPQTLSELRAHAAGLGGPAEASDAQAELEQLADRAEPLVTLLPRAPGQSAARYAHRLCGEPKAETASAAPQYAERPASALTDRIAALEARVSELEARLDGRAAG